MGRRRREGRRADESERAEGETKLWLRKRGSGGREPHAWADLGLRQEEREARI